MSNTALKWAKRCPLPSPALKVVLLVLADCLNDETGRCDPSRATLSLFASVNERTARRACKALALNGLISVNERDGMTPQYTLHIGQEVPVPWKSTEPERHLRQPTPDTESPLPPSQTRIQSPPTPDSLSSNPGLSVQPTPDSLSSNPGLSAPLTLSNPKAKPASNPRPAGSQRAEQTSSGLFDDSDLSESDRQSPPPLPAAPASGSVREKEMSDANYPSMTFGNSSRTDRQADDEAYRNRSKLLAALARTITPAEVRRAKDERLAGLVEANRAKLAGQRARRTNFDENRQAAPQPLGLQQTATDKPRSLAEKLAQYEAMGL